MIEHIVFDFGGVLLELDYEATWSGLRACLGLEHLEDKNLQEALVNYEVGRISEDDFVAFLLSASKKETNHAQITNAWNAMLGPLPSHRLTMLRELATRYQIHLLSNTNKTHIDFVYSYLQNEYNIVDFGEEYFSNHYYSHLIHMRKPDREIYEHVISDIGASPDHVLFIDDNKDNIESACDYGIRGVHHDPVLDVNEVVQRYIRHPYSNKNH